MSNHEQDIEIGRLVREHGERRKEYIALSSRLKRIGGGTTDRRGLPSSEASPPLE